MTNDGMLSQEEIDALLNGPTNEEEDQTVVKTLKVSDYLSPIEEDTIGEIGNISFGSSATTLSTLLNQKVDITTPTVSIIQKRDLSNALTHEHVNIQVNFVEGFIGENLFVLKVEDAGIISDLMLGGDGTNPDEELTEIHLSAVQEAMNQMMGTSATSMSTMFNKLVNISPPIIELGKEGSTNEATKTIENMEEEIFVSVSFQLKIGELIDSNIMQVIPFPFAHELVEQLLNPATEETPEVETKVEPQVNTKQQKQIQAPVKEKTIAREQQTSAAEPQYMGEVTNEESPIQSATFSTFEQVELNQQEHRNLDMLLDIPLQVTVELGRTKRPIKDILDFSAGSIIELDKLAGEPVDILVNQKLIAQGEVVVIDENFGVRVTDIMSKKERLEKIN